MVKEHPSSLFLEASSDDVDDGSTADRGPEPQLSCRVLGNGGQQGFRCETTKSLSYGHRSVVAVFLFSAVQEIVAIQETMMPSMLPAAMMRTTPWRDRISASL